MQFFVGLYHWLKVIAIFIFNAMSYNLKEINELWGDEMKTRNKAIDLINKELVKPLTPVDIFFNEELDRFKRFVEANETEIANKNVDEIFYKLQEYTEHVKHPGNNLEIKWKRNIVYCNTPRGNIIMHYDPFKRAFSYYCEDSSVIYKVLNACAMKYVRMFSCLDLFMDDCVLEGTVSPLIEIMKGELEPAKKETEEGATKSKELKKAPFAKFKRYNLESGDPKDGKTKSIKLVVRNTNKFVYLGKTRDFKPLQSISVPKATINHRTKYDGMFEGEQQVQQRAISYGDFKNNINFNASSAPKPASGHVTGKDNVSYADFKKMKNANA